nr:immunoglobulin heavy chain junction region [Macaca mulatta]MOW99620.1 immunoglobulin heavy chain junction region [Macaca mulatta]MOW99834.1 immunoglobulin heavy chain junction region [Macaca mulatta]MOX00405.1 immunoglobulin heavy chain junction region [Macaca mulatta]MOX01787.1 immunoglobulin heavy chain junction region [Macaca mulatta]
CARDPRVVIITEGEYFDLW